MSKNILIIALLVILIISLGLTALYITQRQEVGKVGEQPVATLSKPSAETPDQMSSPYEPFIFPVEGSDWKTYKSPQWGFEISFPPELESCHCYCPPGSMEPPTPLSSRCFPTCTFLRPGYQSITFYQTILSPLNVDFKRFEFYATYPSSHPSYPGYRCHPEDSNYEIKGQKKVGELTFTRWEKESYVKDSMFWYFEKAVEYIGEGDWACYHLGFSASLPSKDLSSLDEDFRLLDQILATFKIGKPWGK
jgi:hypothetical protein